VAETSAGAYHVRQKPYSHRMTVCTLHSACVAGLGVVETSAGAFRPGQRVVSPKWGTGTWQQYISVPEENLVRNSTCLNPKTRESPSGLHIGC